MSRSLLVYDGSNRAFRLAADALGRRSDLSLVSWESDAVQAFLEAQFGARPFAFILVDGDAVHVGSEAVGRVLRRQGVAASVTEVLERAYPTAATPVLRALHGREPADIHGTFPLDDGARTHIEPLRRSHVIPVEPE